MMFRIKEFIYRIVHLLRTKEKVPIPQMTAQESLLSGNVALVVGGTGGIGLAICKKLLQDGCQIIVAGTRDESVKSAVNTLKCENVSGIILNIQDISSFPSKVKEASNIFGKIDILINCAGINDPKGFLEVTEEIYDKILDINAKGTYFMCQEIAKYMINNGIKGHILNISSASSLRPASTPYIISKWIVTGMTKGIADILIKYGIVVNAIAPGPVATEMIGKVDLSEISHEHCPAGRYAMTDEIANLAEYMVSKMGDMIVGDTFYITGGSGILSLHK